MEVKNLQGHCQFQQRGKIKWAISALLSLFAPALLCILIAGFQKQGAVPVASPHPADEWQLVWSDEFNTDGPPDPANWTYEKGFVRNNELQWYQPQNARCQHGLLVIEARREEKANPDYVGASSDWRKNRKSIQYTSSCLQTAGLHSWKFGRFEMRGRIDISKGLWPAWWTLGVAGRWPANGEIDMMEYYRNRLLANIACIDSTKKALWYSNTFPMDSLGGTTWASRFHIWRMDWDEHAIALYLDDVLLNEVTLSQLVNRDGTGINPFEQQHYMLLNLAMGGDNGGEITAETKFPNRFEIDYVRVYQKR